ncbi:WLM-domain-containing protein [Auriculariales sp. MPI-PUGE-AT-0066]|nr:WLM-domain-containing protein [Auriculariales sp. MPI-PUGE-AT-0066]
MTSTADEASSAPSSAAPTIKLTISHRGQAHVSELTTDTPFFELQNRIEELTGVPVQYQKLIYGKGKKKSAGDDEAVTLESAGLKEGSKIMVIGAGESEVAALQKEESNAQKKSTIMAQRAARGPTKVWSRTTDSPSTVAAKANYKFHRIAPLPHLPNPTAAEALLKRLADDPAIRHIMQMHEFAVGLLTELAPHEAPHLLGLNENAGQAIKLRLRTDRYDGMRLYADVRRVLCHELTHNVWGDHDNNFKALNSQLNREVAEFERSQAEGTHHLGGGSGDTFYDPSIEADAYAGGSYTLGTRRLRAVEAATRRLRQKEEEIEDMCGSASTKEAASGTSTNAAS